MSATPTSGLEWTFDPDRSDGGITVDSIDNEMPEYQPGATLSLTLKFWTNTDDDATVDAGTGGTLGTATGFTLGGAAGASLGSPTSDGSHLSRYEAVREYTRYGGRYALLETIDGTQRISEHTPDNATVDSIVVKLEPGPDLTATDGLWVVLDGVSDDTRFAVDMAAISIDMTVLARGDQYASRSALLSDIGTDLV